MAKPRSLAIRFWRFSISLSKNSSTLPHCRQTRWSWWSPWLSSNTALSLSKWWRINSPACSNWVSTRYTVARPMSWPSSESRRYTSSAVMWRLSLCSNRSRIFRRGSVALRPMLLRSDGLLNGVSRTGTRIRYDTFFSNRPTLSGFLAMRHFLISALLLSLLAGCSSVHIGPHHIDVQQGNALDQENVARLKPGLNRSQVRFLLGTPLVVDPFRNDRWDYVYLYYKAGKLTEQKHISLFFEGDTLTRIEGDVPMAEQAAQPPAPAPVAAPELKAAAAATEPGVETGPLPAAPAPQPVPAAVAAPQPELPAAGVSRPQV